MIKSKGLPVIVFCLMIGILLGMMLAGWTTTSMVESQGIWSTDLNPTRLLRKSAVGQAVPSAAHLSLWVEDFETMLPIVTRSH